jgi:large subunit ribosomal protein L9
MRDTEVLLREHVKGLGKCGDVVRVAPGYARNYLIPQRIAIQATEENKKAMMRRRERLDVEEAKLMAELDRQVEAFAQVLLETEQRTDDHGRLYGSVNAQMIAALLGEAGHEVEEKDVRLEAPIKTVGEHTVTIHLHAERSAEVRLRVLPEGGELPQPEPAAEEPAEEAAAEPAADEA